MRTDIQQSGTPAPTVQNTTEGVTDMETEITRIDTLTSPRIMVIDLDTGTVLGTNLVLAYVSEAIEEEITSSDSAAHDYGKAFGKPLLVDLADD